MNFSSHDSIGVYSIRDKRVDGFNPPFISANDYTAVLATREMMMSNKDGFANLAQAELALYRVGHFCLSDGSLFADSSEDEHVPSSPILICELKEIFDFDLPHGGDEDASK